MLVAGMPAQTMTDLATLANIVKEMKAGKIADALIDLGRQTEELKAFQQELHALQAELKKKSQTLVDRENAITPAEARIAEDRKSVKEQMYILHAKENDIAKRSKLLEDQIAAAEIRASKIFQEAEDKLLMADDRKAQAEVLLISAQEKEAEWESRIKRLQDAALGI